MLSRWCETDSAVVAEDSWFPAEGERSGGVGGQKGERAVEEPTVTTEGVKRVEEQNDNGKDRKRERERERS